MFETKKQSLRNTNMHHAVVFNYSTLNQVGKRLVSPVCHYYTKASGISGMSLLHKVSTIQMQSQ